MEAARAIVAVRGVADGLTHDHSAWLLDPGAPSEEWATAIRTLASQPERAERLGRGARDRLLSHHRWDTIARRTLELCGRARAPSFVAA
jgi:glycosyltransferase involved in cell wall biosynthesis